jgi:shikimate 5-dehydrogenase
VLLLGAGGAARAALVALLEDGAGEVMLLNRTPERARKLASELGTERVRVAEEAGGRFDLVVNATRLGLQGEDPLPIEVEKLDGVGAVMDLVYGLEPTRLVRAAATLGIPAQDGAEMLVQQGAAAFERWWGESPPVAVMRDALTSERDR